MNQMGSSRREFLKTAGVAGAVGAGMALGGPREGIAEALARPSKHVLLISVDGLHAIDLERWVSAHPGSTLAKLSEKGITYSRAGTSEPSDSFPGLIALVTGGTPVSTGIWYDVAFDRALLPPGGVGTPGTVTMYMEAIDPDSNRLDGGVTPPRAIGDYQFLPGEGINLAALPVDPVTHTPVMPWQFLRVNTIFEIAKAHGYRTAWSDKHVGAYQAVMGHSGDGVDDYFSPEINSLASQLESGLPAGDQFTNSHLAIKLYDSLKVTAVVNQCKGLNSTGTLKVGTPGIFGMNFQTISVGQKLTSEIDSPLLGGYTDADGGLNTALTAGMQYVDDALDQMVDALTKQGILQHTTIIITAKHGQCPINLRKRRIVPAKSFDDVIAPVVGAGNYAVTADDAAYI
ncbi:MAG TPA: alkaline phosphatase family protein, partial [Planctomycetota bacterium]|nr:alkaline phosphatase family protein [Planctomycetota bacterium]